MTQKLSATAKRDKAARDKAFAMTPERRAKKAHAQKKHRDDPKGKGKDWDHKDGRWESPAKNRGNDGEGTKKESGKKYKVRDTL
jgi:hypothetical protein